jgi:nitroimidazol reductase NimA-like FMN-containing flavoprotein (pyridoxamine 5'-phosphate oxidase superfamily)
MASDEPRPAPNSPGAGDHAKAIELLRQATFASFAMTDGGRPYVVSLNFAYDGSQGPNGRLVVHTGHGRKAAALAADPRICVFATSGEAFHQGATPCSDGFTFRSVVAEGTARLIEDDADRDGALRAIVAKYDPEMVDRPFDRRALAKTLVYEVAIDTISYRQRP